MASWSFNYGPVKQWDSDSGEPIPQELLDAIENDEIDKWAFNAAFERMISKHVLKLVTDTRSWFCTMVLAYSQSFMGTLEMISKQMGNSEDKQKSKDGKRLIRLFCGPQKPTAKNPWVWRDGMTDPEDWYSFLAYNKQDVVTERDGLYKKLIKYPMPPEEWELYHIDQEINDRGIPIDRTFVTNAITLCDRVKAEMFELMVELTGLSNPNSPTQLLGWIQERGYPFSDLRKETVEKVLRENEEGSVTYNYETKRLEPDPQMLTDDCVKALKMRQASARTSVMKYNAIVQRLSEDDRIHHAFQFGGASRTQRWAGRGVQVHNLPRTPKYLEPEDVYAERLEDVTEIIRQNDYGMLKLYVSDPLDALAGTVRSSIQAPEGMELRVCDLSSIENVSLGALADCQRILNIFREGRDPYKDFGTDFYNVPYEEVTKLQRTNSKPAVLGAGYRLGGGEMRDGKKTGLWGYAENMKVFLSQEEAGASVRIWRENHPEVVNYWYALENAIEKTVTRGTKNKVGMVEFFYNKPYLCCRLPSGRVMYYYKPMVHYEERQSRNGSTYRKAVISYMGKNQITTQWERIESHGGKFTENIVQAFARDVLATGMRRAHEDGFYIVLHVHDELGALQRRGDNYFTYQRLGDLMTQEIPWCPGLPLGYGGYGADFYRKD